MAQRWKHLAEGPSVSGRARVIKWRNLGVTNGSKKQEERLKTLSTMVNRQKIQFPDIDSDVGFKTYKLDQNEEKIAKYGYILIRCSGGFGTLSSWVPKMIREEIPKTILKVGGKKLWIQSKTVLKLSNQNIWEIQTCGYLIVDTADGEYMQGTQTVITQCFIE